MAGYVHPVQLYLLIQSIIVQTYIPLTPLQGADDRETMISRPLFPLAYSLNNERQHPLTTSSNTPAKFNSMEVPNTGPRIVGC